jgi:hypothetical protein
LDRRSKTTSCRGISINCPYNKNVIEKSQVWIGLPSKQYFLIL